LLRYTRRVRGLILIDSQAGTEEEAYRPGYEQLRDGLVGPTTFSLIGGAPHASNVTHPGAVNAEIVNLLHRLAG